MTKFDIKLHNGRRTFSTLSNLPETEVSGLQWDRAIILIHGFPDVNTTFNKAWPYLEDSFAGEKFCC